MPYLLCCEQGAGTVLLFIRVQHYRPYKQHDIGIMQSYEKEASCLIVDDAHQQVVCAAPENCPRL